MTLSEKILRVSQLSASYKDWQDRAEQVGLLVTRRDQLRRIAEKVHTLAVAAEVLSHESSVNFDLETVRSVSQRLKVRADSLLQKFESSLDSLLKPKALDLFEGEALQAIERSLTVAWQNFLGTEGQLGIENVLSRFAGLRDLIAQITRLRQALQVLGSRLPSTIETVEEARTVKASLAGELSRLTGTGLNPEVVTFLRRSVEGVLLSELLSNDSLVDWLETQNLTQYFRVRST
jgi:hypothetical protein